MPLHGFPSDSSHKVAGRKDLHLSKCQNRIGVSQRTTPPGRSHLPKEGNRQQDSSSAFHTALAPEGSQLTLHQREESIRKLAHTTRSRMRVGGSNSSHLLLEKSHFLVCRYMSHQPWGQKSKARLEHIL